MDLGEEPSGHSCVLRSLSLFHFPTIQFAERVSGKRAKTKHAESQDGQRPFLGNGCFREMFSLTLVFSPSLQAKQIELQFTIGEAITSAAIGTSSVAARDAWLVTEEEYTPPAGTM